MIQRFLKFTLRLGSASILTAPIAATAVEWTTKPFLTATNCSKQQHEAALSVMRTEGSVLACYAFAKWSFNGAGIAVEVTAAEPMATLAGFRQLRRAVYRDQSARLRQNRDLREALPGEPPAHSTIPLSLLVSTRTPLGVFVDSSEMIGFADLVPVSEDHGPRGNSGYPLIQTEMLVLRRNQVIRLVLLARISGTTTIAESYRIAEDWALSSLGKDRPAGQQ